MGKKIKKSDNFLELIPKKADKYQWTEDKDGKIQVTIPRDGLLNKIVRTFFKTPKHYNVDLDCFGSFVFKNIDGNNNVQEIGSLLKNQFGENAEPIYERLVTFMNILRQNKFITLEKAGN
nr:PqqD family protein [Sedimentibacter sp.]